MTITLLDNGYLKLIGTWGSDQEIVEAARMSTNKGFLGWGKPAMSECDCRLLPDSRIVDGKRQIFTCATGWHECPDCSGTNDHTTGDEKLLRFLYENKHATPFEMAGLTIEVKAPIMVFREWHRHRTQSYNEMSARYVPLPDDNYLPTVDRVVDGARTAGNNRQASAAEEVRPVTEQDALDGLAVLANAYEVSQQAYEALLGLGWPKELARLPVPVARYSRMRASANLRNWLGFLTLRMDKKAQWEIRQYANAVGDLIAQAFPRTWALFFAGFQKSQRIPQTPLCWHCGKLLAAVITAGANRSVLCRECHIAHGPDVGDMAVTISIDGTIRT